MNDPKPGPARPRTKMMSPYMEWAKTQAAARYTLASSGVASFPLADLIALSGLRWQDLELTGPTGYGYAPLQQALAAKAGVPPECVVAAAGTSMANHLAMAASFEPGDEVLIEWPAYELLLTTAEYLGAKIKRFARRYEEGFRLDPAEVERALTPRTKLIALTNLHNPSSARTDDATLRKVGDLANGVGARVLVDEVYMEACYADPWRSAFHLGKQFIVTSSLTKAYGLSGLRCGWILAGPELARAMWHLNDFYGVNAANPAERLSVIALAHLPAIAARYQTLLGKNRPVVERFLDSCEDLVVTKQRDGTVLFPRLRKGTADPLCRILREKYETSVVPGLFFEAPEHFRMYLAAAPAVLEEGLKRLGAALDEISSVG
ncbi:MAG TPA: aminotransferase class I/II-fold pyridoxal phosphate-dependent enzyme [Terriglobia bacterium]|nr:aminotransferase class I/II-fold pyridoxal phosphate-dependent enzyme [Terriglobia bacterium]